MMNARPVQLAAFMIIASALGFVTSACHDIDEEPAPAEPAGARSPSYASEPLPPEESEQTKSEQTKSEQTKSEQTKSEQIKQEEDEEAPADPQEDLELTWFKGVDNLPKQHPCHDSTPVIRAVLRTADTANRVGDAFHYEISTLGALRKRLGPDWVHFGARTARGVRWKSDGDQFAAITCNMGGVGYHGFSGAEYLKNEGVDIERARDARFIVGRVGEASSVEWGSLYVMRRSGPDSPWKTILEKTLRSNDDESNDPQYTARARIIAAEDSDGDGTPELVSMTIRDRKGWEKERMRDDICPAEDPRFSCYGFEIHVRAHGGDQEATDRVILRLDGKHALTQRGEQPEGMSDELYGTLRAQLEAHREAAVTKARAILREHKKLR